MSGFLFQLGAPLQSWGEHSAFTDRDTVAHPTRSGLIGMLASALGIPRAEATTEGDAATGATPSRFAQLTSLRFTLRTDRPGTRMADFHTVGGGHPPHRTLPTARGGRRTGPTATLVSHRHYLSDAVFTVAVTAPDNEALLAECARALAAPHWPPYLGRRSCPPGGMLLLRTDVPDPVAELDHVPLARSRPYERPTGTVDDPARTEPATVMVRFTAETPFPPQAGPSAGAAVTTLNDDPVRLTARDRVFRSRPAYTTSRALPADLCGGYGTDYLDALTTYLHSFRPEGSAP